MCDHIGWWRNTYQLLLRMELKPSSQLTDKSTTNHTRTRILVLSLVLLATVELVKSNNAQGE